MADEPITILVPAGTDPDRLKAILDAAGADAVTSVAPSAPEGIGVLGAALDSAAAGLAALPATWAGWSETMVAETGHGFGWVLLLSFLILVVAYGLELAVLMLWPAPRYAGGPAFSSRLLAALRSFGRRLSGLVIFALAAILLSRMLLHDGAPRTVLELLLAVALLQRFLYALYVTMAAPNNPSRRLLPLDDHEVSRVGRVVLAALVATALLRGIVGLASIAAPSESSGVQIAGSLIWLAVVAVFFFAIRSEVAGMIAARWGDRRVFGYTMAEMAPWWPVAMLAIAIAIVIQSSIAALVSQRAVALGWTFQVVALTPFALGMVSALRAESMAAAEGRERLRRQVLFTLAEGVVVIVAAVLILAGWGIQPVAEAGATGVRAIGPGLITALVAALLGWVGLRAVRELIAFYDPGQQEDDDAEGDGMGKEGSRLGTVLPVLRGFLVTVILAVAIMVALSALGVNIGPMIAGAGIFGLAIGFGAQKLVADVISGMFFLYEDAFRVGEYIETDEGKGVVEKISLRSARLRHHRGSVVTVPFGSMGTVRNHSRDWVKVKFSFEVPDNTDVEKVRKTVKRVGMELAEDPLLKDKFIEPLKSQGAIGINGSAYVIGVKYTCKPGDQFVIRRRAYALLQKALKEHGIELHTPSILLEHLGGKAAPKGM